MDTFPLFLQVKNKRILLVGNGETAAQKLRLLLKTSATILLSRETKGTVHPEIQMAMDAGQVRDLGVFNRRHLRQVEFAYAGIESDAFAQKLVTLAKRNHVPINIVDRPEFCDFYTASIVDRGHLTVAVGTDGKAPVIGRRVKSLIESLLPSSLSHAVAFLKETRPAQLALPVKTRRDRLDGFATQALAGAEDFQSVWDGSTKQSSSSLSILPMTSQGTNSLTLAAVQAMQTADTLLIEDAATASVTEFARRDSLRASLTAENLLAAKGRGERIVAVLHDSAPLWLTRQADHILPHVVPQVDETVRIAK